VRRACIDIGSNTTRLLVADCDGGTLHEVRQARTFTLIGRELRDGAIAPAKLADVAAGVAAQFLLARELGAEEIRAVATAAVRRARNGAALVEAVHASCGLDVEILTGEEEARLAFIGAAGTLGHAPDGKLGVVDVGGGSSELVLGTAPDQVSWCTSLGIGSAELARECLHSDPPSAAELSSARSRVKGVVKGTTAPQPVEAVAVGGSAASLIRVAGPLLDAGAFERALGVLASEPAVAIAAQFALEVERVRLLPAGLLILQTASELFGVPLALGCGGLREGVLLEAARA
jgi:exopolyphosphatase/guanosine-5'-triphosphate,3'-diphosphate pyrophosphatase